MHKERKSEYEDMIFLEEPKLIRHPMQISHRAKQFAPFDALTGFREEIKKQEVFAEQGFSGDSK